MKQEYNIQIAGFRHNVMDFKDLMNKINEINHSCKIQLLNARGIAGYPHIEHATAHAIKAFSRNENIANDLGIEICVRASAQRQISKALQILGLKKGEMHICAVAVDCQSLIMQKLEDVLDMRDDQVLNPDLQILKNIYEISDVELETVGSVENVLMERTTLLILET